MMPLLQLLSQRFCFIPTGDHAIVRESIHAGKSAHGVFAVVNHLLEGFCSLIEKENLLMFLSVILKKPKEMRHQHFLSKLRLCAQNTVVSGITNKTSIHHLVCYDLIALQNYGNLYRMPLRQMRI